MNYIEKIDKVIPIGIQKFAYQGGFIYKFDVKITAELPMSRGALPYPNNERHKIRRYELEIHRFTNNSIEICLTKFFKDNTTESYLTGMTFEEFVNQIFKGVGANVISD